LFISKAVLILAKHSRYRLYVAGAGTGKELDPRSDLFSFGAVLYEMTSGQTAFLGNTAAIVYKAILNRAPIPLPGLKPELPPKLDEIIGKALEKDRKVRHQNATDIRTDLLRLKSDKGLTAVSAK